MIKNVVGWLWSLIFLIAVQADDEFVRPNICDFDPPPEAHCGDEQENPLPAPPQPKPTKKAPNPQPTRTKSNLQLPIPKNRPDSELQSKFQKCESATQTALGKCQSTPPQMPVTSNSSSRMKEICADAREQLSNKSSELTDISFDCESERIMAWEYCGQLWAALERLPANERNTYEPRAKSILAQHGEIVSRRDKIKQTSEKLKTAATDFEKKCEQSFKEEPDPKPKNDQTISKLDAAPVGSGQSCDENPNQTHCLNGLKISDGAHCSLIPQAPECQSVSRPGSGQNFEGSLNTKSYLNPAPNLASDTDNPSLGSSKSSGGGIDQSSTASNQVPGTSSPSSTKGSSTKTDSTSKQMLSGKEKSALKAPLMTVEEAEKKFKGQGVSTWDRWTESDNGSFIPPAVGKENLEENLDPSLISRPQLPRWERGKKESEGDALTTLRRQLFGPRVNLFEKMKTITKRNIDQQQGHCLIPCLLNSQIENLPRQGIGPVIESN